jgi:hypothetical protein
MCRIRVKVFSEYKLRQKNIFSFMKKNGNKKVGGIFLCRVRKFFLRQTYVTAYAEHEKRNKIGVSAFFELFPKIFKIYKKFRIRIENDQISRTNKLELLNCFFLEKNST